MLFFFLVSLKFGLHLSLQTGLPSSAELLSAVSSLVLPASPFQLSHWTQQQLLCFPPSNNPAQEGHCERTYPLKYFDSLHMISIGRHLLSNGNL